MYAMSAVTALTAQNTTGVYGVYEATSEFIKLQLDCIFADIFPDAVKIGMVSNIDIIEAIVDKLKQHKAKNVVLDPVMVSTSGSKLISDGAVQALVSRLFPLADLITPNIPEAQTLCGFEIQSSSDTQRAASELSKLTNASILIKGGHFSENADDLLYSDGKFVWIHGERINNNNTHGTGCTLSSAIACNLADGKGMRESVENAKAYVTGAIAANLNLGKGSGPLEHTFWLDIKK